METNSNISVICPSYRNPEYLRICLRSLVDGQCEQNDIIVVIDGYVDETLPMLQSEFSGMGIRILTFDENVGMATAINNGVYHCKSDKIFIINDDNVFPKDWDVALHREDHLLYKADGNIFYKGNSGFVISPVQIEPVGPSMFGFPIIDCGRTFDTFDFDKYQFEQSQAKLYPTGYESRYTKGQIFPIYMLKKDFMIVDGFSDEFKSPFIVDWAFFLKLQLLGKSFAGSYSMLPYHFGSSATKNGKESAKFRLTEGPAAERFRVKYGFPPYNGPQNDKIPPNHGVNWL